MGAYDQQYNQSINNLDKTYKDALSGFDQQANIQSQEAYILNQKMAKYLGQQNTAMGVNGLTASDQIGLQNNFISQLGNINQQRDLNKGNAFAAYQSGIGSLDAQRGQNLYQVGLLDKQAQNEKDLMNTQNQKAVQDQAYSFVFNKVYSAMAQAAKQYSKLFSQYVDPAWSQEKYNNYLSSKQVIVDNIMKQHVDQYKDQIGQENYDLIKLYLMNYTN
jgi:hypothetical protein